MDTTSQISQHIIQVCEGGNWTNVSISECLSNVTVQEATQRTKASVNTIAALLHHLMYWNRVMIERINGIDVVIPATNGFDVPELSTEEDWRILVKDFFTSAHALANAITAIKEDRLNEPILPGYSSVYKNLQGSIEHIHYHLGQMTLLKQLIRNS